MLKNPKHEAFAQAVALGSSAAEAYRECVSGGKCSQSNAETTGPALARSSQVALRIESLRKSVAETAAKKFSLTKDKWLERLEKASKSADSTAGEVSALREIGKAMAWYAPEKVEHSGAVVIPGLEEAVKSVFAPKV